MAEIRPFCGIRPREELAGRIAALPYDVYSTAEARAETEKEPLSFLRIDRAETQLEEGNDPYAPEVYEKARELLWKMVADGELVREEKPCFYLYELTWQGRAQTGLVACASVDDYLNGTIKKHENTRADKEEDRVRHVDICSAQTGPIFLAYRKQEAVEAIKRRIRETQKPAFAFVSPDGVGHRGWVIEREADITFIRQAFAGLNAIYIADGHHRAASAVRVGQKRRAEHPGYTGEEEFNYFLSVLFPDEELRILDYNRVVRDLNGMDQTAFLESVQECFSLEKREAAVHPETRGRFGMYLAGEWYELRIKETYRSDDPVSGLDVSLLQERLLSPILGIRDPKTDQRIDFVGGIRGLGELERRVDEGWGVAFSLYPTSIAELFAVADAGRLMPPKSTWFEPKLRSGLFIHEL